MRMCASLSLASMARSLRSRSFVSLSFGALLLATAPVAASAQSAPEPDFSPRRVEAHVDFLASDELEGRNAGTRGYDVAARYVATQFEAMGLQPGGVDGSWYQQVPLVEIALDPAAPPSLSTGTHRFANGNDVLFGAGRRIDATRQHVATEVVFVGHGVDSDAVGRHDYAGVDVRGKVVAYIFGPPEGMTPEQLQAYAAYDRAETAAEHGAVGTIALVREADMARFPWDRVAQYFARPSTNWVDEQGRVGGEEQSALRIGAYARGAAIDALFEGSAMTAAQAMAPETMHSFTLAHPVTMERQITVRRMQSPNVLAVLPGSDPAMAGQYVLLMAHLDHEGIDPTREGDQIYNGAMDNAVGTATMLEAARAFTTTGERPRRPILFAAVTAEEDGLIGSQYLAHHPSPADGHVVGVVNLDMPVLLYDFKDVVAFGAEHSTLGPIVERATARAGVTLSPDPMPEENLFVRSDHYSFVQAGVPSVFLVTGFQNGGEAAFRDFLANHYHQPSDQVDLPFDWNAGAKFARINYLIAREIANADQAPMWYRGDTYGDRFAPDAPRADAPETPVTAAEAQPAH